LNYDMPRSYHSDLWKHDRAMLEEYNPSKFVWVLRESGTQLISCNNNAFVVSHCICDGAIFFIFKNGCLSEATREKAQAFADSLKEI